MLRQSTDAPGRPRSRSAGQQPAPHTPPAGKRGLIAHRPRPAPDGGEGTCSSPDPPLPPPVPKRVVLVSPPPQKLRPTVTKLPRITQRSRLLISHGPTGQRPPHWPSRPLPEERAAQRQVSRRFGQGASVRSPVYIGWGAGVQANALVSVVASPLTAHAEAAAQLSPVIGITCVLAMLYDIGLTRQNVKSARHDYLMGAVMLHQEIATLDALELESQRTGHPINPQDQQGLAFNIAVLRNLMERFEAAYYPRSQQPYLQRIREQIAEGARAMAALIAQVDGLARERGAFQAALEQAAPDQREALLLDLHELDALSQELQAAIDEQQQHVVALLSRRRLRQRAQAQWRQAMGQLTQAQLLAQARERVNTLDSAFTAAWSALAQAPHDAQCQADSQAAQQALREARGVFKRRARAFPAWQQALDDWVRAHHGRAPTRPEQKAIVEQLITGLQAQADALQREAQAFRSDWWRGFFWYEGLSKDAIKQLRDLRQQGLLVPVKLASTALSIASLAVDVVGAAFGSYGLTLVSSALALLMARGDNKDGRLEQHEATQAKLTAWTRLARAGELMDQADKLSHDATRALAHTAARVLTVCAQRTLQALHQASTLAKLRRTKGELNYLLIVVSVVSGGVALATGGVATPFLALPSAALGGLYLGSVGLSALNQQALKRHAQGREAVAEAFVRAFGVDDILAFYVDMASGQPQRVQAWRQRLQTLSAHWQQGLGQPLRLQALVPKGLGHPIQAREFEPEWLWDNDFLLCQCATELIHRHVRDRLHGPCAAADVLRWLDMPDEVLKHLLNHFSGVRTPAGHRRTTELHIASFFGARPYPLKRLPAHIDRRPQRVAPQVERLLAEGLKQLSAPTQHQVLDLLVALQTQGEHALLQLKRTDEVLRRTFIEWMASLRQSLQADFIGPRELLALQQALIEDDARRQAHQASEWPRGALPLLCSPIGPLWLELLADRSYLQQQAAPPAEPLPPTPPGPVLLGHLTAATKLIGRALRDGDLRLEQELHAQHRKPARERANPSLVVEALRLAPLPPSPKRLGAPPGEAGRGVPTLPPRPGLGRRATHAAFDHSRRLGKRVRQTGRNPMGTPAKALSYLQGLPPHQAARVCGWVLEQLVRQHSTDRSASLPRSPEVMAGLTPQDGPARQLAAHLRAWLVAVRATARRSQVALRRRERLSARDRAAVARLQDMRGLCKRLMASLSDPLTRRQLRGVRLTA